MYTYIFFYFYHISVQVKEESILKHITVLFFRLASWRRRWRTLTTKKPRRWRSSRTDLTLKDVSWTKRWKGKRSEIFSSHPKSILKIIAAPLGWAGTEESTIITSNKILFVGTRNRKQTKCRSSTYVDWDLVNVLGVVWNIFFSHFVRVYPSNQQ